ncbi:hypothetical protein V1293_004247 [Bradyrhizobium sp. AZCC 1693]
MNRTQGDASQLAKMTIAFVQTALVGCLFHLRRTRLNSKPTQSVSLAGLNSRYNNPSLLLDLKRVKFEAQCRAHEWVVNVRGRWRQFCGEVFKRNVYPSGWLVFIVARHVNFNSKRFTSVCIALAVRYIYRELSYCSRQYPEHMQVVADDNADISLFSVYFLPYVFAENAKSIRTRCLFEIHLNQPRPSRLRHR